eukprot:4626821-Pleurochrysis_carterae.AAC.1
MAAMEAAMRTQGKLHIAIAEAAGREERHAALLAAGTEAAIGAAADDWRAVRSMAPEPVERWAGAPPVGWPAAARRLVDGLAAASAARRRAAEPAAGGGCDSKRGGGGTCAAGTERRGLPGGDAVGDEQDARPQ